MAHAEVCPICGGSGAIGAAIGYIPGTATDPICHGCGGCGWVSVPDEPQGEWGPTVPYDYNPYKQYSY